MEKVKAKKNYEINRNDYVSLLILLAVIAGAVAELFAILSDRANTGYPISVIDTVMILSEVAVGLLIVEFVLSTCLKGRISSIILDILRFAAVALFCVCMYYVLVERADLMGYVWFSTLESDNPDSVNALNYGVISAALYVAAIIICAVTGGFDMVSAIKQRRTRESLLAEIAALEEELKSYPADETAEEQAGEEEYVSSFEPLPPLQPAPASETPVQEPVHVVMVEAPAPKAAPAAAPAPAPETYAEQPVYTEKTVNYKSAPEDKNKGVTDDFIKTLTVKEKNEFMRLFVTGEPPIAKVPPYEVGGDNKDFFSLLFINLSKTRSLVSAELMAKINAYHSGR